jgi:hypothetical protein
MLTWLIQLHHQAAVSQKRIQALLRRQTLGRCQQPRIGFLAKASL